LGLALETIHNICIYIDVIYIFRYRYRYRYIELEAQGLFGCVSSNLLKLQGFEFQV
jgi:hypothetical protein